MNRSAVLVSAGLHRRGGGVAVVGRLTGRALAAICKRSGRSFRALDLGPAEDVGVPNVASFAGRHGRLAAELAALQVRGRVEALVFDHVGPARVQAWLPGSVRAPYAVWMHGIEVWTPLSGDRRRALEGAALLIANSRFTWDRAVEYNAWLRGRPHEVVHLAVEELRQPSEPELEEAVGDRPYFLMVGRLSAAERYKGHAEAIEAFSRLAGDFPDARLVIVGEGDDRPRLEALAASHVSGGAVTFRGFVSDDERERLLAGCRALVLPSTGEGFGLVFIEALRWKRPFVACSGTVAEEVSGKSGAALLVPAGDSMALVSALRSLLTDSVLASRMGAAGRALVAERFTPGAFETRFEAAAARLVPGLI